MAVSTDSRLKQYVDVKLLLDGRLSGSQAAEWDREWVRLSVKKAKDRHWLQFGRCKAFDNETKQREGRP
jgi:hypothetical protein